MAASPNTDWLNGSGIALDGTSYLFALVGGKLARVADNFTTMSGREVALHIYVEPGKEERCFYAMDRPPRSFAAETSVPTCAGR